MAEEPLKLPKMDYKMLIMGGMMLGSRQIDFKKIENVALAQQIFYAVIIAILSIYFILYQLVERKKDTTIIWVPPKPTPALPFGPQPEPVKPSDYQKTTVYEHEIKLLKEGAMSAVTSGAIAIGMSLKFNIHASLVMQSVMAPIGLFDVSVFKKYFLGHKEKSDGSSLYGEVLKDPMAVASERKPIASIVEDRKPVDDTPRVEELDEDMD